MRASAPSDDRPCGIVFSVLDALAMIRHVEVVVHEEAAFGGLLAMGSFSERPG
jgi:hypothetical protein